MRLDRLIESRLALSARSVRNLFAARHVRLNGSEATDSRQPITEFCGVEVDGHVLQPAREALYLMLHKPRGCASATVDDRHPTVLDLIDLPNKAELHLAGRLDFNTTGLLLLTNDGRWSRQLTLPQQKIPKRYLVETKDEITLEQVRKFAEGFYFRYENLTTLPAELTVLDSHHAELTIYEGRYHQIKRMFGYFQNEVTALHRLSMGPIALDPALAPGSYRHLRADEIASGGGPLAHPMALGCIEPT
ncbi:MAG: 16S rRNA pseudouridine(516) synthase [Spongiibacteraceae bacterium]|nr:16S rRNA pseudouridine(516) synthase [Spongiibacteraceae bacterium]